MSSSATASTAAAPSATTTATSPSTAAAQGTTTPEDQQRILEEALHVVRVQSYHMKRCLDANKLMDAIKHCSTMLAELRSQYLTPRNYYELYMAIFDELQHLTTVIYDAHMNKRHHLSDLYELVQYAGNIVPRLYLMITVGTVYMRVSKELLPLASSKGKNALTTTDVPPRASDAAEDAPALANIVKKVTDYDNETGNGSEEPPEAPVPNETANESNIGVGSKNELEVNDPIESKEDTVDENGLTANGGEARPESASSAHAGEEPPQAEDVDDVPPIKELMQDMLEMSRGVQHPIRGLFLRYFLSTMTRDYLPDGLSDGLHGNIYDSIQFILHNFIEMNKLWVRLQHQGHSRERERRERERKDLRLLVGSNLVRLSQLNSLDLEMYQTLVIPNILTEIVTCKDTIAQEYLMEVIVQVFHDDFHLRTLDSFLQATAQLQPTVNVKQIVISLIDRFANYAARAREEVEEKTGGDSAQGFNGIFDDIPLFEIFWEQVTNLINTREELGIEDTVALMNSLCNLSLNCYIDSLENIDKILFYVKENYTEAIKTKSRGYRSRNTILTIYQLLLAPVNAYASDILTFLKFPSSASFTSGNTIGLQDGTGVTQASTSLGGYYSDLLFMQPFSTRRKISHTVASIAVKAHTNQGYTINSNDGVNLLFGELCSVLIRDHKDGGLHGTKRQKVSADGFKNNDNEDDNSRADDNKSEKADESTKDGAAEKEEEEPGYDDEEDDLLIDWEDIVAEQSLAAKLVQLWKVDDSIVDSVLEVERAKAKESSSIQRSASDIGGLAKKVPEYPLVTTLIPDSVSRYVQPGEQLRWTPHLVFDTEYVLLVTTRKHFGDGGSTRMRFTLPALILACIRLVKKLDNIHITNEDDLLAEKFVALFKFVHQAITSIVDVDSGSQQVDNVLSLFGDEAPVKREVETRKGLMSAPEICLRLYVDAARVSSNCGFEELAYEFFVQAFNMYENSIGNSGSQNVALTLIMSALYSSTVFGYENYETLVSKAVVHCSRLVRRIDQCRSVVMASFLFWGDDRRARDSDKPMYRDGRKVLECLQKALKVADSALDRTVNVELFIEILEYYNWYFEARNEVINANYIISLLDLVRTNLTALEQEMDEGLSTNDGIKVHNAPDKIAASGLGAVSVSESTHSVNTSKAARAIMKRVVRHYGNTNSFLSLKGYLSPPSNIYYGMP